MIKLTPENIRDIERVLGAKRGVVEALVKVEDGKPIVVSIRRKRESR